MKQGIHPNWNTETIVICACGNKFTTGSTMDQIKVDICSKCHPLYTGQQKFIDTLGQVERFQKKTKAAEEKQEVKKQILQHRASKNQEEKKDKPSLKDLLMQARKNLQS